MSISYKIDATKQRVFTCVTGPVSALDIVGHFELARREGFLPFCELIDASNIAQPSLSIPDLWKTAATIRNLRKDETCGYRAVWVGTDAIFALAQTFAALVSSYIPMKVFRDQMTAEEWLNTQCAEKPVLSH